ncbi:hypothetical protein DCC81_03720 [Chitinophaga parva]|uniref:Uncharacterized protein n=1 Tax=Chitinophaga parva TaxID=2169414 RepID=A0A2T7BLQ3_9BACT|nr:hypothetical protein [Chitinophaga parva]PUZ28602.1 hypothetical protein DCC81_03720 [Chitinophaga parva]
MKKHNLFFGAAVAAALLGAVVTNAHSRFLDGFQQSPGACTAVSNIPPGCNLTSGTPCTNLYFNKSTSNPAQCVDQRFHI